jgi:hypothetical protein
MDKNTLAGIYLILGPAVAKLIEVIFTRSDRRFKLGYNPFSLSPMGWLLTLGWLGAWVYGLFRMAG